jgi:poly-D-alanine transfer protein DltD
MRGMPLLNIEEGCCGLLLTVYKDFDPAFFQKFLFGFPGKVSLIGHFSFHSNLQTLEEKYIVVFMVSVC